MEAFAIRHGDILTTDDTETSILEFAQPDETSVDYTCTVVARSEDDRDYYVDLRLRMKRTDGVATVIRSFSPTNENGPFQAFLDHDDATVRVRFVGPVGKTARASAILNMQLVELDATPPTFAFDGLPLSTWYEASFAGAPWAGTASAGASATRNLVTDSVDPTVGTAINGKTPASFDGSSQHLTADSTLDTFLDSTGTGDWWVCVLFKANAASSDSSSTPYNNPALIADLAGIFSVHFTNAGFGCHRANGASFPRDITACGTGAWHLGQAKYDSSTGLIHTRVDSGPWSDGTLSGGNMSPQDRIVQVGSHSFNGDIARLATMKRLPTDEESDGAILDVNDVFGLSL